MYTVDGLVHGIDQAKKNIKMLEKAIDDERKTIADYRVYIDKIEQAEKRKAEAEANVHVEVVTDDDPG